MLVSVLLLIAVVVLILIFYGYYRRTFRFWERKKIPVIVRSSTEYKIFLMALNRLCLPDLIIEWYNQRPDKSVYGMYSFTFPILFVKDPNLLRQILIKDFEHFTDHMDTFMKGEDEFFSKNLFALKGKRWHTMRTLMSPAFTGSKMRNMLELINECGEQLEQYFEQKFNQMGTDQKVLEIEFLNVCTRFTNDVICTVAMGIKVDSLADPNNKFYRIGQCLQNMTMWRLFLVEFAPRFADFINVKRLPEHIYDFFKNTIRETIETRERENIVRPDMIHILTEARNEQLKHDTTVDKSEGFAVIDETEVAQLQTLNKEASGVLTVEDIVAQAFIFFIGGYTNVAITMAWASYELAVNPDVQTKLYNEIVETREKYPGKLTYDALMKMKYLDMVVTETLRKWPPLVMTDRQVTKPYKMTTEDGDFNLEKGMYLIVPVMGIHRDPKYYPNPDKFDPERFRDPTKIQPFTYLPFGNGPRMCIGSRLVLMEVKAFLVYMLSKFEFTVVNRTPIPPRLKTSTNLELKDGFWLGLKRRIVNK